jgi:hypothetical protein
MFETLPRSDLATWRSPHWPIESPTPLVRLKDHRRFYLDYEGDLIDHRGRVERVAGGECEVQIGEGGRWTIRLLTGTSPTCLLLRQIDAEQWEASPVDSAANQ